MQPAYAACILDSDWPEKPCLDTPPYSKGDLKAAWQGYYDYKGEAWMETKKAEMVQAIKNGSLNEWVEYRSAPDNFANNNVYFYYFLNDQAPDINDYSYSLLNNREPRVHGFPLGWVLATVGIAVAGTAAIVFVLKKAKITN
ncbi:MAG TPA: hypothetical protein VIB07_05485 [Nitrososphaera sp.]